MSTITTRQAKGARLTHNEVDANFTNLNTDKVEKSGTDPVVINVSSASDALRVTQTGSGNALVVEDSANPDSTPFVVDAGGSIRHGAASTYAGYGAGSTYTFNNQGALLFQNASSSWNSTTAGAAITYFSNNVLYIDAKDTASAILFRVNGATERMSIDAAGNIGVGGNAAASSVRLHLRGTYPTSGSNSFAVAATGIIPSGATALAQMFRAVPDTQAASFTITALSYYYANQGTIGANSSLTSQYAFFADSGLTGATNNYGFFANIAAATGRWAFYDNGGAASYFKGDMQLDKTVTTDGTTGAQTINKNAGSVNFAASATSLVVTNSRVTTSSIIIATVATNDTTMKSVAAVAASGSFTLHANAAATAETRVNFLVIN